MKHIIREIMIIVTLLAIILLVAEAICRFYDRPYGDFDIFFPNSTDLYLYPPNKTLTMTWGPIPYIVQTNNQGFRGENFTNKKNPSSLRILTIGDSVTDGFFVDNPSTWQYVLQSELGLRLGIHVEVINGARGGGSIDKELAMLRKFAPRVSPDIVILTFATNDITEILGLSPERLLQRSLSYGKITIGQAIQRFIIARTGLGEFLFHFYLTIRSPYYRQRPKRKDIRFDDSRYNIAGAENYAANAALFMQRLKNIDGLILGDNLPEGIGTTFLNYCTLLKEFCLCCKAAGADPVFVYFPAYPQIYDTTSSRYINGRLRSICTELGIDFIDLTDGFRTAGMNRILYLAPLDFHPTPAGNAVFAKLVADHLTRDFLLSTKVRQRFAHPHKQ